MKAFLLLLVSLPAFAADRRGNDGVGGGDAFVAEFLSFDYYLSSTICKPEAQSEFPEISCVLLKEKVNSAVVESTGTDLVIDGREVDALNYPGENRIRFNRQRWVYNQRSRDLSFGLVMHEFLGLMQVDDSGYRVSARVVSSLKDSIDMPTSGISLLKSVRLGSFSIAQEKEDGQRKVTLGGKDFITKVSKDFLEILRINRRGQLLDGRILRVDGLPGDSVQGIAEVCRPKAPYGFGVGGNKLKPYKTVAFSLAPIGAQIYIPSAVGVELPDGSLHNGYFKVVARAKSPGMNLKIFIGLENAPNIFEGKSDMADVYIVDDL
jgi:hypothetical protein